MDIPSLFRNPIGWCVYLFGDTTHDPDFFQKVLSIFYHVAGLWILCDFTPFDHFHHMDSMFFHCSLDTNLTYFRYSKMFSFPLKVGESMSARSDISLLFPSTHMERQRHPSTIDMSFLSGLGAEPLFDVMKSALRFKHNQKHPLEYFTDDIEVITYRLDVVEDLLKDDAVCLMLEEILPKLEDIQDLQVSHESDPSDTASSLYSVAEIELYTECIDKLYDCLHRARAGMSSTGMKLFTSAITSVYQSGEYQTLKEQIGKLTYSVRNIKSITVGINLDAQLRPVEAGIVSLNQLPFRSGNVIDKILRVDFDDTYTCLAPLDAVGKGVRGEQLAAFRTTVISTLDSIIRSSIKEWRPIIRKYTISQSKFLFRLVNEIRFLLGGLSLLKKLKSQGVPVCKPQAVQADRRCLTAKGLYHPVAALHNQQSPGNIVLNDIEFDDNGMIYILTGPNQGGKTVFTQAVGIIQMMFQLGLFVPAYSATISPVDCIFTEMRTPIHDGTPKGRFGEECFRVKGIFEQLTRHSLVLMDETFSSTSAIDGTFIASELILGLRAAGCRAIFATHLHDLAQRIDELNKIAVGDGSRVDSLSAGLEQSNPGTRNFKISRARPEGLSYAKDIANKYGITFSDLLSTLKKRNIADN